nr:hypothetical protein [Rhodococcus koreensis]
MRTVVGQRISGEVRLPVMFVQIGVQSSAEVVGHDEIRAPVMYHRGRTNEVIDHRLYPIGDAFCAGLGPSDGVPIVRVGEIEQMHDLSHIQHIGIRQLKCSPTRSVHTGDGSWRVTSAHPRDVQRVRTTGLAGRPQTIRDRCEIRQSRPRHMDADQ